MSLLVMRPSGVLGDQSIATYLTDGPPAVGVIEDLSVVSARLIASANLGIINSVTLSASVSVVGATGTPSGVLTWSMGGVADTESAAFSLAGFAVASGAPHTICPWTGLAWTWSDLNALTSLGAVVELAVRPVTLSVSEVCVTVDYTAHLATPTTVERSAIAGEARRASGIGGPGAVSAVVEARGAIAVGGPTTASAIVKEVRGGEGAV